MINFIRSCLIKNAFMSWVFRKTFNFCLLYLSRIKIVCTSKKLFCPLSAFLSTLVNVRNRLSNFHQQLSSTSYSPTILTSTVPSGSMLPSKTLATNSCCFRSTRKSEHRSAWFKMSISCWNPNWDERLVDHDYGWFWPTIPAACDPLELNHDDKTMLLLDWQRNMKKLLVNLEKWTFSEWYDSGVKAVTTK